jgi:hypothetical protein
MMAVGGRTQVQQKNCRPARYCGALSPDPEFCAKSESGAFLESPEGEIFYTSSVHFLSETRPPLLAEDSAKLPGLLYLNSGKRSVS